MPASWNSARISSTRAPGSVTSSSVMMPGGMGRTAKAPKVGGLPARSSTTFSALVPTSRPTASILGLSKRDIRSRNEAIAPPLSKSGGVYHGGFPALREKFQAGAHGSADRYGIYHVLAATPT